MGLYCSLSTSTSFLLVNSSLDVDKENCWSTSASCTFILVDVDRLHWLTVNAVNTATIKNSCTFYHAPKNSPLKKDTWVPIFLFFVEMIICQISGKNEMETFEKKIWLKIFRFRPKNNAQNGLTLAWGLSKIISQALSISPLNACLVLRHSKEKQDLCYFSNRKNDVPILLLQKYWIRWKNYGNFTKKKLP